MSPNKRIVLNVIATYGRSLFALVCGLFSSRWLLMSLGRDDFGLYGVIAGLAFFMSFFVEMFSSAVGRFYAVAIGKATVPGRGQEGCEECRMWFNLAFVLHVLIPGLVVAIGYALGVELIRGWLSIPVNRVMSAIWVFRFVCLQSFIGMASVPFYAMYTAKQYIAELTIYSFVQTVFKFFLLYYMVVHPGEWLISYAGWMCFIAIVPNLIVSIRAYAVFPEIGFDLKVFRHIGRLREIFSFAGCKFIDSLGRLVYWQGAPLVVNKFAGVGMNASVSVSTQVSGHVRTLAGAMVGAFSPVIISNYGAGRFDLARAHAYRVCKFAALCILLFSIPLAVEMQKILVLWLKDPPTHVDFLCEMALLYCLVEDMTLGMLILINATGRLLPFSIFAFGANLFSLVILIGGIWKSGNVCAVGIVSVFLGFVMAGVRLFFARQVAGISIKLWFRKVLLPVFCVFLISFCGALVPRFLLVESFVRVCLTTFISVVVFFVATFFIAIDREEREFLSSRVIRLVKSFLNVTLILRGE